MSYAIGIVILVLFIELGARVFFKFSPISWLYQKIRGL